MTYARRLHSSMNCSNCRMLDAANEREPFGHCLKKGREPYLMELRLGCSDWDVRRLFSRGIKIKPTLRLIGVI